MTERCRGALTARRLGDAFERVGRWTRGRESTPDADLDESRPVPATAGKQGQ